MMLTDEQKKRLKDRRLMTYDARLYELTMDKVAAEAVGDHEHASRVDEDIAKLQAARAAVENM